MKAVVYNTYGPPDVLTLTNIDQPKPKDNEVLVKIHAATVTSGDARLRSSNFPPLYWLPARLMFGLFKPKKNILGHELAGVVEEVGKDVTTFAIGDQVFATTTMLKTGSYAEYICLPQEWKSGVIALKPSNLSYQEAAALPVGAMTALFLLRKAGISANQDVLVYGASGSVGSYAIQIVKQNGSRATAVCSQPNFDMVQSLGAHHCIDYRKEDVTNTNQSFDIVFDAVGKLSKSTAKKVLRTGGQFVTVKMLTKETTEHLELIKEWAEQGKIRPFIDRTYRLEDMVEAHKYVDSGRKRGNVVIDMQL